MYSNAIVREVPDSFTQCVTSFIGSEPIDVNLARKQHKVYCETLVHLGLKLINLPADNSLPDCCFVEDTAIVLEELAIITKPGVSSRVAETIEMQRALDPVKMLYYIKSPGTIEGGDVLKIDKKLYIGTSSRTNEEGIKQVNEILSPLGYSIIPVTIKGTLHLKSVVTYLGKNTIILAEGHLDETIFSEYDKVIVPVEEAYCANCLEINGKVLIPKGYPYTKSLLVQKGFDVIELDMSEFKKADGALTCKSILF